MGEFSTPLPPDQIHALKMQYEISTISSEEAARVSSLATLISQTINSTYDRYIPRKTKETNFYAGRRVIVTDDLEEFSREWEPNYTGDTRPDDMRGVAFIRGRIIAVLNPEVDWGRCCPHCKDLDIEMLGSETRAKELYKGRYYTTQIAHEEIHQNQDWNLPSEFIEMGAAYYTSIIARKLGHNPLGGEIEGKRYDAYEALVNKYGDDVHRVFFGSVNNPIAGFKKAHILQEAARQKEVLFPHGQDLPLEPML